MRLIVGLGNPGRRYEGTPHNVGHEVVDELAARHTLKWRQARRLDALFADGWVSGVDCMLLKPTTYMNLSGEAVAPLVRGERLKPADDVLVVVDDVALELGLLRLRQRGSAGGHNGLRSLIAQLGSADFPRLRCGVGPRGGGGHGDLERYVLAKWAGSERPLVDEMVMRAADAAEEWLTEGPQAVMNKYNVRRRPNGPVEDTETDG